MISLAAVTFARKDLSETCATNECDSDYSKVKYLVKQPVPKVSVTKTSL